MFDGAVAAGRRWMSVRFTDAAIVSAICLVSCLTGEMLAATIAPRELSPYQVIRAKSALIRHGDRQSEAPASLYDGTGLTHENPLLAQHGSDPDTLWQYPIRAEEYPVSIELDLGEEFLINELWIWQLQGEELEDQGLQEFEIVMRDAGYREVGLLEGTLDQFDRVGVQPVQRFNAFGECIFLPIPDCVRFIELRIRSNRGDDQWVGLAEVAFAGWQKLVPEPSTSSGLLLAGLVLWGTRRRASPLPRGTRLLASGCSTRSSSRGSDGRSVRTGL
jgi:hypothetical protein